MEAAAILGLTGGAGLKSVSAHVLTSVAVVCVCDLKGTGCFYFEITQMSSASSDIHLAGCHREKILMTSSDVYL